MKNLTVVNTIQQNAVHTKRPTPLLSAMLAGLVLCSVSVVTQAAEKPYQGMPAFTLKVITHGEGANRSDNMSEPTRQDNRRTDISMQAQVQDGTRTVTQETTKQVQVKVSDAINRTIRLADGGIIWISKDPAALIPTLNVTSASRVEINAPITFNLNTNYADFIDSWELAVYRSSDSSQLKPLATFMGRDLKNGRTVKWDGKIKDGKSLQTGDKLSYVLTVKDKEGRSDVTREHQIAVVGADRLLNKKNLSSITSTGNTAAESNAENDLARQTIPVHGSRVRIHGRDIAEGNSIRINDEVISVSEGEFVTEQLLPEGKHSFNVAITDNNQQTFTKPLSIDLKSKYMFMVALADVTVGEGKVTGNMESLSDGDKHLDGDIFVDGRLAFYLKGKIKGKYLVTAQMDTGTEAIEDLFDDIHKKDPRSLFRRLDPDKYYPVYGDDSTLIDDTDSQGKMYVRVDWDKSRALWGNYNTDLTGTELSAFNRSLYGAKLNHKSPATTKDGDHKTDITVFGSEAQSAFRHNQFLGTGGSLYYLKDSDIVDGSEKVWIEIRDQNGSERALEKITLEEGRDYEIDDFQGRIILNRPLLQIAGQSGPNLVKDTPLNGDQIYLMVDYEYVPDNFKSDKASYGVRGKAWLNDNVAIGGTVAHEDRVTDDYDLKGVDVTFKKAKGTYVKVEYAESEANQAQGSFLSTDGGLNFGVITDATSPTDIKGKAYSVEARADLKKGTIGAWYKDRDAGFSTSRLSMGTDTVDTGIEALIEATEKLDVSLKASLLDKKDQEKLTTASIQGDYKASDKVTLSAELRHVKEDDQTLANQDGEGTLGAFKVGYDVNKDVNLYAIAQGTIDKSGDYEKNDLITIGTKARINSKLDLTAELSTGSRGDAATLGANYQLTDSHSLYTNVTHSTDSTNNRSIYTVGQRKSVTDQLKVYTEHQFTHEDTQSGVGHTFGLDYDVSKELTVNASVQAARLDKASGGLTDRDAFSVGLNYSEGKTQASTRLEYRRDKGTGANAENTEQWLTTNQVNYRVNPSLRLQGKFNHSETKDKVGNSRDARFTEAGLGFALRPVNNDRLNILGRLTYLYDLKPIDQSISGQPDERSTIVSLESNYQVDQKWNVGGKLAYKKGEIRSNRDAGTWSKNDATLAAARVRYHLTHKWDAMAEYHWMNSDASDDTAHGAMVSVDRHIGKNMKIGVGYNFTNFDDDLSNTSGTAKGWFINLVGKY